RCRPGLLVAQLLRKRILAGEAAEGRQLTVLYLRSAARGERTGRVWGGRSAALTLKGRRGQRGRPGRRRGRRCRRRRGGGRRLRMQLLHHARDLKGEQTEEEDAENGGHDLLLLLLGLERVDGLLRHHGAPVADAPVGVVVVVAAVVSVV